jgi:hypothetical protein
MSRSTDYAVHGRIKEAAKLAGALDTALDDFVSDYINYRVDEAELSAWIERCRSEKGHRFVVQGADMEAEAAAAFGPNGTSLQRRADFARKYGAEAAENAARQFNTSVASTKPGVLPPQMAEKMKVQAPRGDNPWAAVDARGFPTVDKSGRFLPAQLTKQTNLVRTLCAAHGQAEGLRRAEAIARAAGCAVGSTRPPKAA